MFFGPVEVKDGDRFYIQDGKNLVVAYPPYEVAPYAAGVVTFAIPLDGLSDILAVDIKYHLRTLKIKLKSIYFSRLKCYNKFSQRGLHKLVESLLFKYFER